MNRLNKFGIELGELLKYQNISVNEYSKRIGTTPKNLIDIIDGKVALSFNMICNISFVSNISVDYISNVENGYKIEKSINELIHSKNITTRQLLNKFNYKELRDKYDVIYRDEKNDYHILEDIMKYLRISDINIIYKDNNHIFYKSNNDKPELLALWLERCYKSISNQRVGKYNKDNINILVDFIRREAKNNFFNKSRLIKEFNKCGIFLAIESDLNGSKIRGAFRVLNDVPAIYITTKHKRIADIYYALLHELAHCKSDYNRAKNGSMLSFMDDNELEEYELKADNTALSWMVNENDYKNIINNKLYNYEIMSFLVYRLAMDNIITYSSKLYQECNKLIEVA